MSTVINTNELRERVVGELEKRRLATGSYRDIPGEGETLYGILGAVNILAALGQPLGSYNERTQWAERILAYQLDDGSFESASGSAHALGSVLQGLNLLGAPIPEVLAPLAPLRPQELPAWLETLDWTSTHKALCGQTRPLLASGIVSCEWISVLKERVAARIDRNRPLETWCSADAPRWKVISCIYHVLSPFDDGRVSYPHPRILIKRLLDLEWENVSDTERRTECTDGDWAAILLSLCNQLPEHFPDVMSRIRKVAERRVAEWNEQADAILQKPTFLLYCFLWGMGLFQQHIRDCFRGPYIWNTLDDPALFRMGRYIENK